MAVGVPREATGGGGEQQNPNGSGRCLIRSGPNAALLHYSSERSANNEFNMHAATALGVARRSQSKRHGAVRYTARAGASSSPEGNPARASTA